MLLALALIAACGTPGPEPDRPPDPPACAPSEWYPDIDRDGYGAGTSVSACEPPDGHVADHTDCHDADPDVHPGAPERCDGLDQDCDEEIDEGVTVVSYMDRDGDGYGVIDFADEGCEAPEGWATAPGDCDDDDPDRFPDPSRPVRFTDVTSDAGLDWFALHNARLEDYFGCFATYLTGGVAVGDFDDDGRDDLFFTRTGDRDLLYRNVGDGTFEEVSAAVGIDHIGTSTGAVFFDGDGDGDLDLYVVSLGTEGNRLYVNGGGTFTEEAALRGADVPLGDTPCSTLFSVSAGDVDGDGDLDLHTANWATALGYDNDRSRLLINDGSGRFADRTVAWGAQLVGRAAFTSGFVDYDGDGDLDIPFAGDWGTSGLLRNDGGAFTEVTAQAGVGTDENGMGSAWADYDADGDLDWFVSAIYDPVCEVPEWGCSGNRMYRNDGGVFNDVTDAVGVRDGGWAWGAAFFDHDNDGVLDLVQAGGYMVPPFAPARVRLWVGDGERFVDEACEAGLAAYGETRAVVPFDMDDDGDLDLILTRRGNTPRLLRNDGGSDRSWLQVTVDDQVGAPFGAGATVTALTAPGAEPIRRRVHRDSTFLGTGPLRVHLGLGDHEEPLHELIVDFADGSRTVLADVPVRQHLTVTR